MQGKQLGGTQTAGFAWGRRIIPIKEEMQIGERNDIIKKDYAARTSQLNKSIIPLPICYQMREFASQLHWNTKKWTRRKKKTGGKCLPSCFGAAKADYPGKKCLGKLWGTFLHVLTVTQPQFPYIACSPKQPFPGGESCQGLACKWLSCLISLCITQQ